MTGIETMRQQGTLDAHVNPVLYDYEHGFNAAIEVYNIENSAFRHPKANIFKTANRLFHAYEIDPKISFDAEANLITLALADQWLSSRTHDERKGILDTLKLIAVGPGLFGTPITYSRKVLELSKRRLLRGTTFDPEAEAGNSSNDYTKKIDHYIETNFDPAMTEEMKEKLALWNPDNPLNSVRTKLKLTPKTERPLKLKILTKTSDEMSRDVNFTATTRYDNLLGTATIIVGSNLRSLEHEFAHYQFDGIAAGYNGYLFLALTEAMTENCTSKPKSYPAQRQAMERLFSAIPGLEDVMYEAYKGQNKSKIEAFSNIINTLGLEGFLLLARMTPVATKVPANKPEIYNGLEKVFVPVESVIALIVRKTKQNSL